MIKLKELLTEASLSEEMTELKLYIDNDSSLYRQRYMPILKNLSKKKKLFNKKEQDNNDENDLLSIADNDEIRKIKEYNSICEYMKDKL